MCVIDSNRFQGWALVQTATIVLTLMTFGLLMFEGFDTGGVRLVIRATARTSALFFCAAFAASGLVTLWGGRISTWMLRNRRYLGMSFGVSHTIHYMAVGTFAWLEPDLFLRVAGAAGPEKLFPIVMLALLMGTSFDRTAAMLGPRAWKTLHLVGTYFFWIAFLASFAKRAEGSAFYSAWTALLILTMGVRLAAMAIRFRRNRSDIA